MSLQENQEHLAVLQSTVDTNSAGTDQVISDQMQMYQELMDQRTGLMNLSQKVELIETRLKLWEENVNLRLTALEMLNGKTPA